MKASLYQYRQGSLTHQPGGDYMNEKEVQLVLCFGAKALLQEPSAYPLLRQQFPGAAIASCSTAGEILGDTVSDDTMSVTAITFSKTLIESKAIQIGDYADSFTAGKALVEQFPSKGLRYLLVLSDGSKVNGSELARGLNSGNVNDVIITGGLAGDGANFQSTLVGLNEPAAEGIILAIGFYGSSLQVAHGTQGGWEMFGVEKEVTSSDGNILYEINGHNALDLYKKYLGPEAAGLPGSALLFPLSVALPNGGGQVVRTILSIDEDKGSMTFAGDIPRGAKVKFMKANFDKITNAASEAAAETTNLNPQPRLALLISCVGRKLILQSRIDEEVEAINEVFGGKTLLTGFYSYGEISPLADGVSCQLHNQTMTITTLYENE